MSLSVKAIALALALTAVCSCGTSSQRSRTPPGPPDPGLPVASLLDARDAAKHSPLVQEVIADEPLGLWRLGRDAAASAPLDGHQPVRARAE